MQLFGVNQVCSFIIAGLGETITSIAWGSEFLADLGVYPFVVPLRPIPGSRLEKATPPLPDIMKQVYNAVAKILQTKGIDTDSILAGCARCRACTARSTGNILVDLYTQALYLSYEMVQCTTCCVDCGRSSLRSMTYTPHSSLLVALASGTLLMAGDGAQSIASRQTKI